jgi:hypothetical protein
MKTAMQELIELIVNNKTRLDIIEKNQQMWLEKEKEQMFEFADTYVDDVMGGCVLRANEYFEKHYNETYKQYGLDDEARQILNNI